MKHIMQLARQFFDVTSRKVGRYFLHLRMRNASEAEVLAAERKMRGVEQLDKLQRADIVIVSFGKSGRTWLRVMISHLFRVKHDLPENALLAFDNFHNLNRDIPKIFFTHDNYIKDLTGDHDTKQAFYGKRVVFLARDPRDVAVSQFFQWKFRMNAHKSAINNYPLQDSDTSIFDFVTGDGGGGVSAIAEYMNLWAKESPKVENFHLLRYESLRANPHEELAKLLDFMQVAATQENIDQAVDYSSYENMKKMESKQQFKLAGARMKPADKNNPDSFKVRRAKIGGYRDYFDDSEVTAIDGQLADQLNTYFGYS